jgi:hypothetical protein
LLFSMNVNSGPCCLSDYLTGNYPSYFAADTVGVPTLQLPVG